MHVLSRYFINQARLAVEVLPYINFTTGDGNPVFALKGGTAINLFVQQMPRFSVDIDLVYCPLNNRQEALDEIRNNLASLGSDLESALGVKTFLSNKRESPKLLVESGDTTIKVEVNSTIRGTLYPPLRKQLCKEAEDFFKASATVYSLQPFELYAGKICAALDRQHPRDLFDLEKIVDNETFMENVSAPFMFYVLSHNRPAHEILNPGLHDISSLYDDEFCGMTIEEVSLECLMEARRKLLDLLPTLFTEQQLGFMLSLIKADPAWELSGLPEHASRMPSIGWKLLNLERLKKENPVKFQKQIEKTEDLFSRFSPRPETSEDEDAGLSPC